MSGGAAGLGGHPGNQGPAAEHPAQADRYQRQLRTDLLRRADDPGAAVRQQWPVAHSVGLVGARHRRGRLAAQHGAAAASAGAAAPRPAAGRRAGAGSRQHPQGVRRPGGGQRHYVQGARRRNHGPDRPQRRRQEHDLQPDQRRAAGHARPGALPGRSHRRPLGARDRQARRGPHLPARAAAADHVGAGKRGPGGAHAFGRGRAVGRLAQRAPARPSCCTKPRSSCSASGWATICTSRRATWRWASNASWKSPARWRAIRCC